MKDFLHNECEKALKLTKNIPSAAKYAADYKLLFKEELFPDSKQEMIKATEREVMNLKTLHGLAPIINSGVARLRILKAKEISLKPQVTIPGGVKIIS